MNALAPPGPELAAANRRLVAVRCGWPRGALEMCEHLDAVHPGWTVQWRPASTIAGWEHAAGYFALHESVGYVCGEDPAALVAAIRRAPVGGHWHDHQQCCDRPAV